MHTRHPAVFRALLLVSFSLIAAGSLLSQAMQARLERDLNIASPSGNPSGVSPRCDRPVVLGGVAYFLGGDASTGYELMRWDEQAHMAVLVRDIRPGAMSSEPHDLIAHAGSLWFLANDGTRGVQLWASDGTRAGTRMVVDLGALADPRELSPCGPNTVALSATSSAYGRELFVSDGTAAGSRYLDLEPGLQGSEPHSLYPDAPGKRCLFAATTSREGTGQAWMSDGTSGGTRRIAALPSGELSSRAEFRASSSRVFVSGAGRRLFALDSASASSVALVDGVTLSVAIVVADVLYFPRIASRGQAVWQSDGTSNGTRFFANVNRFDSGGVAGMWRSSGTLFAWVSSAGATSAFVTFASPVGVTAERDFTFVTGIGFRGVDFYCRGSRSGDNYAVGNVWVSDGSSAGTRRIEAAEWNQRPIDVSPIVTLGGATALMVGFDKLRGRELYELANAQIRLAQDLWGPGDASSVTSNVQGISALTDRILCLANDGVQRYYDELLRFDSAATGSVAAIRVPGPSSQGRRLGAFCSTDQYAFFSASFGLSRPVLMRMDATGAEAAGFSAIPDYDPRVQCSRDRLYVVANQKIYVSDGTASGTRSVATLIGGAAAADFVTVGDGMSFAFTVNNPALGRELWWSDGTSAGTRMVGDLRPGAGDGVTSALVAHRGHVYFAGFDTSPGIFRSDGTAASTARIGSVPSGVRATRILVHNGELFFVGAVSATVAGLYRVAAQSARVTPRSLVVDDAAPMASLGSRHMLFVGATSSAGAELWVTDGTSAGTRALPEIRPGPAGASVSNGSTVGAPAFAVGKRSLYFAADDGVKGRELWRVDPGAFTESLAARCSQPGRVPTLRVDDAVQGTRITARCEDAKPGSLHVLLLGQRSYPAAAIPGLGCRLHVDLSLPLYFEPFVPPGASWTRSFDVPLDAALRGAEFTWQGLAFDGLKPVQASNAVRSVVETY